MYHTAQSAWYSRTQIDLDAGERWFCTEDEAIAAGWRAPIQIHPESAGASEKPGRAGPCETAININAAGVDELEGLPGIGRVLAQRIIDYRSEHGPFSSVDELEEVDRIGPATVDKIRNCVTVE